MDDYPQPRPVLYGTTDEAPPPQTQTAPVRKGPPRYPPAPPATIYAPQPEEREPEPNPQDLARASRDVKAARRQKPEKLRRLVDRVLTREGVRPDDPGRLYLREVAGAHLLSPAEESALVEKLAQGRTAIAEKASLQKGMEYHRDIAGELERRLRDFDRIIEDGDAAKTVLVVGNLRLVLSIARRYTGLGLTLLDAVDEGIAGLTKAAGTFDTSLGYSFSVHAAWWIRHAITRKSEAALGKPTT